MTVVTQYMMYTNNLREKRFILIPGSSRIRVLHSTFRRMIHTVPVGACSAGGRSSGLVGRAYGRCSTDTNPTIPLSDSPYALQSVVDPGAAAHGPIKLCGRSSGFRATPRATASWAPRVFSRWQAYRVLIGISLSHRYRYLSQV